MAIIGVNGSVEFETEINSLKELSKHIEESVESADFDRITDFQDHSVGEDQESWDNALGALIEDLSVLEDAVKLYKNALSDLASKSSTEWSM